MDSKSNRICLEWPSDEEVYYDDICTDDLQKEGESFVHEFTVLKTALSMNQETRQETVQVTATVHRMEHMQGWTLLSYTGTEKNRKAGAFPGYLLINIELRRAVFINLITGIPETCRF